MKLTESGLNQTCKLQHSEGRECCVYTNSPAAYLSIRVLCDGTKRKNCASNTGDLLKLAQSKKHQSQHQKPLALHLKVGCASGSLSADLFVGVQIVASALPTSNIAADAVLATQCNAACSQGLKHQPKQLLKRYRNSNSM